MKIENNCNHKCHDAGLNPWIANCPICCCPNPKYDADAVSDVCGGMICDVWGCPHHEKEEIKENKDE